jgi:signal transduction histidine kinase
MATQLNGLYEEQRRLLRVREEFMQAAAHELKTPITTIKASVYLALASPDDSKARKTLEVVERQAARMALLVEDLLTAARLRGSAPELERCRIDLGALAKQTVQRAESTKRHTIVLRSRGPLFVQADRDLIALVLSRLLENAMAASPDNGAIEVSARREDHEAVVSVVDCGAGIPEERQAHIFEPFYEAVPSGRPGYLGVVSLRLHICKRILEAHCGRIWFVSRLMGSEFSFALPLADL